MTDAARSRQPGTARELLQRLVAVVDAAHVVWTDPVPQDSIAALHDAKEFLAQPDGPQSRPSRLMEPGRPPGEPQIQPQPRAQPDGPQEIDVERLARALEVTPSPDGPDPYVLRVRSPFFYRRWATAILRAQQPEGGAEGEDV